MSKVAIQGAATGTGVFTLASPATNTDRTLVLPDEAGTVLTTATPGVPVNGPAFSAYQDGNQIITTTTWTKAALSLEAFDTNANFDTATYRFTPTVAGYYQLNASAIMQSSSANITLVAGSLYKNGTPSSYGTYGAIAATNFFGVMVSDILYMNGSTDYVEFFIYAIATSPFSTNNRLTGALVRTA